jgi:hypothetical protein
MIAFLIIVTYAVQCGEFMHYIPSIPNVDCPKTSHSFMSWKLVFSIAMPVGARLKSGVQLSALIKWGAGLFLQGTA